MTHIKTSTAATRPSSLVKEYIDSELWWSCSVICSVRYLLTLY